MPVATHQVREWAREASQSDVLSADESGMTGRASANITAARKAALNSALAGCRADYHGPTLVFDVAGVRQLIATAREVADRHGCDLLFAVKSLPEIGVLVAFASAGVGLDVSNEAELTLVRRAMTEHGVEAPLVSVTGPAPGDLAELESGLGDWVREAMFNVEASDHLSSLPTVRSRSAVQVGARIALDLAVDRGRDNHVTRFGVDPHDLASLSRIARHPAFVGLHCHVEHETNDAWVYGELAARVAEVANELGDRVSYINLGGGLDRNSGLDGLDDVLCAARAHLPTVRLLLEPGGWWFAGNGFAVGRVLDVRRMRDGRPSRVTLDLSAVCHLRWARPRLVLPTGDYDSDEHESLRFCGPTCSEEDVIGTFNVPRKAAREHLCVGHTVLFGNVSGYAAAWNTDFNGVPPARLVLHDEDC